MSSLSGGRISLTLALLLGLLSYEYGCFVPLSPPGQQRFSFSCSCYASSLPRYRQVSKLVPSHSRLTAWLIVNDFSHKGRPLLLLSFIWLFFSLLDPFQLEESSFSQRPLLSIRLHKTAALLKGLFRFVNTFFCSAFSAVDPRVLCLI